MKRRLRHERVVINTRDEQALRGIVLEENDRWIVLANPESILPQGVEKLSGTTDLWVPRANVSTVQTVPA